jgi:exonuclease SbcD
MRILHTADWHLGKRLHKYDLRDDHDSFFHWMCQTIHEKEIDVLLVSGDVFDQANPSNEARSAYYRLLSQLMQLGCQVVITGGNHDSPSELNAPQEILRYLKIHVLGKMPENPEDVLIPLFRKNEQQAGAVVSAIPYLRDSEIRKMVAGESQQDRFEAIRNGIRNVFDQAADLCAGKYQGLPALAMGHLYAQGVQTCESERDIQVGNLAGFDSALFHKHFSYYALGHIHRPQRVGEAGNIYYSGSPVSLSFSERDQQKRVILLNLNGSTEIESIPIPGQRKLLKINGNLTDIASKLEKLELEQSELHALLEVELEEPTYDPAKVMELESLLDAFDHPHAQIVKHRVRFLNKVSGSSKLFAADQVLEDIQPIEVFEKRLEKEGLPEQSREMLMDAFREILEEVNRKEA